MDDFRHSKRQKVTTPWFTKTIEIAHTTNEPIIISNQKKVNNGVGDALNYRYREREGILVRETLLLETIEFTA